MNLMVGMVVCNTVLLSASSQNIRVQEKLSLAETIRKAAGIRARPVVVAAVAALLVLALERGL